MQPMKTLFESDGIEIPDDPDIASDLRLLTVKAGVAHVPALRSGVSKDRHGDAAVALALAIYASRRKAAHFGYQAVTQGGVFNGAQRSSSGPDDHDEEHSWRRPLGARLRTGGPW
jgi:phage FluMu gp28-like protein